MTNTVGLRERKKAQTRQALRDSAMALFSRHGFDATTIEEIAEACDMSPRTFFRYFPTKEDVLLGDSGLRCAALLAVLAAQPPDRTPLAALHAAMRTIAYDYQSERSLSLARLAIIQASPSLRAYKSEAQRGWEDAILDELVRRAATAESAIPTLELRLIASVSIGALRAALDTWLADDTRDLMTLVDEAFALVADGFSTGG
jgi:AcrR family transcriptional regulator